MNSIVSVQRSTHACCAVVLQGGLPNSDQFLLATECQCSVPLALLQLDRGVHTVYSPRHGLLTLLASGTGCLWLNLPVLPRRSDRTHLLSAIGQCNGSELALPHWMSTLMHLEHEKYTQ